MYNSSMEKFSVEVNKSAKVFTFASQLAGVAQG